MKSCFMPGKHDLLHISSTCCLLSSRPGVMKQRRLIWLSLNSLIVHTWLQAAPPLRCSRRSTVKDVRLEETHKQRARVW